MDQAGVGSAVLCAGEGYGEQSTEAWVIDAVERHPDRFTGSIAVDPGRG
jgi:hypothetical protein